MDFCGLLVVVSGVCSAAMMVLWWWWWCAASSLGGSGGEAWRVHEWGFEVSSFGRVIGLKGKGNEK